MGLVLSTMVISCSRVEPNYEGVLMENYGRNGKADFQLFLDDNGQSSLG